MASAEIEALSSALARLPGLGPRSARRAVLHLVKKRETALPALLDALLAVQDTLVECRICGNVDTRDPCGICSDPRRDAKSICVVEDVADLWALDRAKLFTGKYHVLGGKLSALDGVRPEDLNIASLMARVEEGGVDEIVLAMNATLEGQTTAHYLAERLETADPMLRHILRVVLTRFREVVNQVHGGRREGEYEARMLAERDDDERDGQMAMKRLRIEQQLEMAIDNGELELFYQPILRVADRSVSGFEALIRWRKPDGEMVPPAKFIPIAEQSNLMRRMGYWITDTAIAALSRLQATSQQTQPGQPPLTMRINLSVRQFGDPDLFPCLQNSLADHQVDPRQVRLEITESMLFDSWELALGLLNQAKELGCRLAIDDFGTGYSSLSYLHRFPVDTLKIDQCFVREMFANQASRTIVRTMGVLARDLGMDCIAEGIEEQAQGDALRKMGIEYVQGFFYGKPMPEAEVVKYLHAQGIAA